MAGRTKSDVKTSKDEILRVVGPVLLKSRR